jgi:hypothetical protein
VLLAAIAHPNPNDHSSTLHPVLALAVLAVGLLIAAVGVAFLVALAKDAANQARAWLLGVGFLVVGGVVGWLGVRMF